MTAAIIFDQGGLATAHHRRSLCLDWLRQARMQRLQFQHEFLLEGVGESEWRARFDLTCAGPAEETWLKQLPLPPGAKLIFPVAQASGLSQPASGRVPAPLPSLDCAGTTALSTAATCRRTP